MVYFQTHHHQHHFFSPATIFAGSRSLNLYRFTPTLMAQALLQLLAVLVFRFEVRCCQEIQCGNRNFFIQIYTQPVSPHQKAPAAFTSDDASAAPRAAYLRRVPLSRWLIEKRGKRGNRRRSNRFPASSRGARVEGQREGRRRGWWWRWR